MAQSPDAELDELIRADEAIHSEADELLHPKGLLPLLEEYGTVHIDGSYKLRLMVWRDLDVYLAREQMGEADFFELGGRISSKLSPPRMRFRDTRNSWVEGLPEGLYWGVYLGNERAGAWKIDMWALDPEQCKRLISVSTGIADRLTPATRLNIMRIKSRCWQDPEYRHSYSAMAIYRAVLDDGIEDIDAFREYLRNRTPR